MIKLQHLSQKSLDRFQKYFLIKLCIQQQILLKCNMHKLTTSWTFWENIQNSSKEIDYQTKISKLFTFINLQQFATFWNHENSFISSLRNFFATSKGKNKFTIKEGKSEDVRSIQTISIFRQDIQPLWQHQKNKSGGEFYFLAKISEVNVDELYQHLVFDLIGQNQKFFKNVLGIRFHQKKRNSEDIFTMNIKIEYWINLNSSASNLNEIRLDLVNYLKNMNLIVSQTNLLYKDHA